MADRLNPPHGGTLLNLIVNSQRASELKTAAKDWPSWDLSERQICDLELLLNGGFSPLKGFMGEADYASVCERMRLADGTLWPMPITLDVSAALAAKLSIGAKLALRDPEGVILAVLTVSDLWTPDLQAEATAVFGTTDLKHPGAAYLLKRSNPTYVGGTLEGLQLPFHYDYRDLRLSPTEVRALFTRAGWRKIVAFQTRNPIHRAHFELTKRAAEESGANLLIHPVVGMTKLGDVDHYTRVRCYRAIMPHYPLNTAQLALLPLAMRMGGPREALWHALIRKNYGCSHLIVGRDHAGPGKNSQAQNFYGPYDAQELLQKHSEEIGIEMVPFKAMAYVAEQDQYFPADQLPAGATAQDISGTELRARLQTGREIPEWFTYPEVVRELRATHPPRSQQGFTVFFTGLSGSGKSTIANVLLVRLLEMGGRPVTLLDGDIVRKHLSSELGFSKEHRDINIRRIGYVASEITKNGGIALCAPIAPYEAVRQEVRDMIGPLGGFVLVHMSTPIDVCEGRDRKGLYAAARAGKIKGFTGIDDPYEVPPQTEISLDTSGCSPAEAAQEIILYLEREGFIGDPSLRRA